MNYSIMYTNLKLFADEHAFCIAASLSESTKIDKYKTRAVYSSILEILTRTMLEDTTAAENLERYISKARDINLDRVVIELMQPDNKLFKSYIIIDSSRTFNGINGFKQAANRTYQQDSPYSIEAFSGREEAVAVQEVMLSSLTGGVYYAWLYSDNDGSFDCMICNLSKTACASGDNYETLAYYSRRIIDDAKYFDGTDSKEDGVPKYVRETVKKR